ncbi:MAG TPA: glycosyltransferase family 4 protein [Pyrinomonadaceae bacterium]|jgi:glycosyltransferase involved in cell wall biosynthesis|nr:glycosyltransferase family 4 protein [Pyrinomonadaceae bacterium]
MRETRGNSPGEVETARSETGARPLRVLVVAASLDILGGQSVEAQRILRGMLDEPSVELSFLPVNPRLPGALRGLQRIKYVRTVVTSLMYWALLLARVPRYDVLHVFSPSYFSFLLAPTPAVLVARLYGKKVVLNYHSGEAEDHLAHWRTAIAVLRLADAIVTPSNYLVDVFARFQLSARAVPYSIETDRFRFRERTPLRPLFLSNRNHEPLYNVGCILRAFARIQRSLPEARLVIVGDGSQHAELERLARELVLRHAEFAGRVEPEEMHAFYDAADVFLNASNIDNMPISILEAFAAGTPVVTTNAGGIPYIVADGENGLMVECGDCEALARSALRLFEEPGLASKLAGRAHEQSRRYAWAAVRDGWLKVYREVAGEAAARREVGTQEVSRQEAGRGEEKAVS